MDMQLTLTGAWPKRPTEPCESCRTPVQTHDMAAMVLGQVGIAADEAGPLARVITEAGGGPRCVEVHLLGDAAEPVTVLRQHTTERCELARAGQPEPVHVSDDDEDDDDGY